MRFIGVTGHGLRIAGMHRRSLEAFDFDSVLLPYNFVLLDDAGYRADVDALLDLCAARQVAVQTIKSLARRRWTDDSQPKYSWYEPLVDPDALARSVRWVLDHPRLFLNSSSDARPAARHPRSGHERRSGAHPTPRWRPTSWPSRSSRSSTATASSGSDQPASRDRPSRKKASASSTDRMCSRLRLAPNSSFQ